MKTFAGVITIRQFVVRCVLPLFFFSVFAAAAIGNEKEKVAYVTAAESIITDSAHDVTSLKYICTVESVGVATKAGQLIDNDLKTNQDASLSFYHQETKSHVACVFDGHGPKGNFVSNFLRKNFKAALLSEPYFNSIAASRSDDQPQGLKQSVSSTVKGLEDRMYKMTFDTVESGSTAVIAILRDNLLTLANFGDSRAILIQIKKSDHFAAVTSKRLTTEHKPNIEEERSRIESSGGVVVENKMMANGTFDTPRVAGLGMSRTIGDSAAHETSGVISTPGFTQTALLNTMEVDCNINTVCYVVLASDGLWDVLSDDIVSQYVAEKQQHDAGAFANDIAEGLVKKAVVQWRIDNEHYNKLTSTRDYSYIDDTTVLVLKLATTASV